MSLSMKAVVLFLIVVFVIAPSVMANAQPATCTQAVQNANNLAATIASYATNYWAHRQNFVDFVYGKKHSVANWETLAATEMSLGAQLRGPMPNALASFQAAIATVQALNCMPAATLQTLIEATTTHARTINHDRFPVAED
jgi:hypothetical protein